MRLAWPAEFGPGTAIKAPCSRMRTRFIRVTYGESFLKGTCAPRGKIPSGAQALTVQFKIETMVHYERVEGGAILVCIRWQKLFPTTEPMTEPMMAPATNSENQWMVTETPMPT
jgi:hypothetical protein